MEKPMNTAIYGVKVKAVQEPGFANVWSIQDEAGNAVARLTVNGEADAWAKRIEDALNAQTAAPQGQTDTRKESLTNDDVGRLCVAPHQLKSAGIDQVLGALRAGGSITKLASSFYSGGYSYTHVLTTKRGTQYRVSKQVMRWVPDTAIAGQAQP